MRLLSIAASNGRETPSGSQCGPHVDSSRQLFEFSPPIGVSGDQGPAAQPPSPTFGATSPTRSFLSVTDEGAFKEGSGVSGQEGEKKEATSTRMDLRSPLP